ncbi:MAG: hypothetical protein U5K43_11930 [Halofilum sp. (in: g-proteobacteria)]|nr:hypothetical protein [Halofilum sp. (in: g-proteobacteria)]
MAFTKDVVYIDGLLRVHDFMRTLASLAHVATPLGGRPGLAARLPRLLLVIPRHDDLGRLQAPYGEMAARAPRCDAARVGQSAATRGDQYCARVTSSA